MAKADNPNFVNAVILAEWLGCSVQSIGQMATSGWLVRAGRGQYDLKLSIQTYCINIRRTVTGRGDSKAAEARVRLAKEQADKIALHNAQVRGELVPAAAVVEEWAGVCRTIRANMLAVPSRVGARLPTLTPYDIAQIDAEIRETLTEVGNNG